MAQFKQMHNYYCVFNFTFEYNADQQCTVFYMDFRGNPNVISPLTVSSLMFCCAVTLRSTHAGHAIVVDFVLSSLTCKL